MRVSIWACWLLAVTTAASAQSLGDVARKEKKRRQHNQSSGATVRVITDADVRPAPPIVVRPGTADVLSYLDDGGYTFPVLFDSGNWDSPVATSYGVSSIPRTFLLDRNGRILYDGHPQGLSEETIQAAIAANE